MFIKSKLINGKQHFAREYKIWNSIRDRCKVGGKTQLKHPSYIGCGMSENFQDFQFFADWCNRQIGFNGIENGRFYHIDKDILIKNNQLYSEHTCVFVPGSINNFLVKRNARRGNSPIGVSLWGGKYISRCSDGSGNQVTLGYFDDPYEAFLNYKRYKEYLAGKLALEYADKLDARIIQRLKTYEVEWDD